MNDIFRHYLDQFVMVFLNYILIYSKSVEEHEEHMILVLQVLSENHLYAKLSKCPFYHKKIQYLGHIISNEAVAIDPRSIQVIMGSHTTRNVS